MEIILTAIPRIAYIAGGIVFEFNERYSLQHLKDDVRSRFRK